MSRTSRPHDDRRDLAIRLEPDGIHDDADGEPDILLVVARDRAGAVLDMERIVACVNACRGIATEHLGIVGALADSDRTLIHEQGCPRWTPRRTGSIAASPTRSPSGVSAEPRTSPRSPRSRRRSTASS